MTILNPNVGSPDPTNAKSVIGKYLSVHGITQTRVAGVIGKSQSSVSRKLSDQHSEVFDLTELQKIVNESGATIVITPSRKVEG